MLHMYIPRNGYKYTPLVGAKKKKPACRASSVIIPRFLLAFEVLKIVVVSVLHLINNITSYNRNTVLLH